MTNKAKIAWVAAFLVIVLGVVPWLITVTQRWDLYYTLTSVALLSIASAGVWITFYIGRINIGQGAFAAIGGYTAAILITRLGLSFWIRLPLSGITAALIGFLIGLPILRLKGVYFAMLSLCMTEAVRLILKEQGKLGERLQKLEGLSGLVSPEDELEDKRKKIEKEFSQGGGI